MYTEKYLNIIKPSTGMWLEPNEEVSLETECLFGETVNIIEQIKPGYEKYILLFFDQIMKHLEVSEKEYKRL